MKRIGHGIRAWVADGFLTAQECEHLIGLGQPSLAPSMVVDDDGQERRHDYRTSWQAHLRPKHDDTVASIESRIALVTGLAAQNGEGFQILRYQPGECYKEHTDFFDRKDLGRSIYLERGGQRVLSMILYLNDVERGGHTYFPREHLSVRPVRGRAVFWCNVDSGGNLVWNTMHEGQPPESGEKWIANKWIHERAFA